MTRRPLAAALFLPFLIISCGPWTRAAAFDYHGLMALDGMVTVNPSASQVTDGELGMRARAALLGIGGSVDIRADFWARLGAGTVGVGNPTVQELRELSLKARDLGGRVDLTIGRFLTPGGFWLIADGGRVDLRYASWLTQSVYGGLRAFGTDRRNLDLTTDNPIAVPLAGTSLVFRHRIFDLSLTFTWSRDAIDLHKGLDATSAASPMTATLPRDRHVEDEFFLDVQALILPTDNTIIAAGGSFGTRYDVRFGAQDPTTSAIPATLDVATLGALSAWLMAEWRPVKPLRLEYSGVFERIRLIQSQSSLFLTAAKTPTQLAPGDFLDNGVRASLLVWKAMRADLQYRLRYRSNTDLEHHVVAGIRGDQLLLDRLGFFASVGLDVIDPGVTTSKRILYSGGLSFVAPWLDARAGVLFTDGIGSGLLFSQAQPAAAGGGSGVAPTQLFPYVLETNRIAFLRVFGIWRGWFAGIDVEENLDSVQLRAMAQIGAAR